jgi:sec-independent protein translocase protein TatB
VFDISFSELLVIAVVALLVIGPEKLPKVARTAGAFFGRLQRFVAQVKDEVNRESRFAELQKLQQEVQSSMQQHYTDIERSILPSEPLAEPVEAELVESKTAETGMAEMDAVKPAAVKKPRKPRAAKAEAAVSEKTPAALRRRSKAAISESESAGSLKESAEPAAAIAPEAAKTVRRPRKPKPKTGGDTTDMFEP